MQAKASLQKWKKSFQARIQLSQSNNGGGNEVIQVDTAEIFEEWFGQKQMCGMQRVVQKTRL